MANVPMPSRSDLIADAQSHMLAAHDARQRYLHAHQKGGERNAAHSLAVAELNTAMAQVFATMALAVPADGRVLPEIPPLKDRDPYPFRTLADGSPIPENPATEGQPTDDD